MLSQGPAEVSGRGGLEPRFLDAYRFHLAWLPELTTLSVAVSCLHGSQRECVT